MLPAAKSGIVAGIVLGIGRAIGETMAVVMVAGNAAVMPDGLLSGVSLIYSIAMGVLFLYFAKVFDGSFINEPRFVANRDGMLCMSVFAFAVAGGCLGFLKSNSYPAKVFMGDTGSMALGGAMSAMVIYSRSPFLFLLMGVCIVASAVSVVLQVGSFKLRHGKRIFKMTPIHHHFELCGWKEEKIVFVFTAITLIMCVLAYLGVMNRY